MSAGCSLNSVLNEDTKTAYGEYRATQDLEGPPNIIHAGIVAAILDETMIMVNKYLDIMALTGELNIRYLQRHLLTKSSIYVAGTSKRISVLLKTVPKLKTKWARSWRVQKPLH